MKWNESESEVVYSDPAIRTGMSQSNHLRGTNWNQNQHKQCEPRLSTKHDLENDSSSKLLGRLHVFLFRSFFRPSRGIATRTRYSFSHTEGFQATEEFLDLA